jgi:hypothetical protein
MAKLFESVAKIDPAGTYINKKDPILRNIDSGLGIGQGPKLVTTPRVLTMPTDEDVKRAKRLAQAAALQRTGRSSTILSQPDGDQLGA